MHLANLIRNLTCKINLLWILKNIISKKFKMQKENAD